MNVPHALFRQSHSCVSLIVICLWNSYVVVFCSLNSEVFKMMLQAPGHCKYCSNNSLYEIKGDLCNFKLNDSQLDAVASCILASECSHRSSVGLVWGPPGTGKTTTVFFDTSHLGTAVASVHTRTHAPPYTRTPHVYNQTYNYTQI